MTRKKDTAISISGEEDTQVQHLLEQFRHIAQEIHNSTDREQVQAALAGLDRLSEAAQMVFLKALAKERTIDAADLLLAVNEFSPSKNVRKEARRSLIRLAEAMVYPRWSPPVTQTFVPQVTEHA